MKRQKKIGLTEAYQNEETTQAVFRCLLALLLLPVTDIDPAFQDVKVLVHDDTLSKTLLLQLCRYVERQWLNTEALCIRFTAGNSSWLLLTIYRPGSSRVTSTFFDELSSILETLVVHGCPVVVGGDLNVHVEDG